MRKVLVFVFVAAIAIGYASVALSDVPSQIELNTPAQVEEGGGPG